MTRMRQMMDAERQSQQVVERMQQIENQISRAARKSKEIALKRYIAGMLQVKYCNYNEVDPDMQCVVCQYDFVEDDYLVVFECDPKHYFHK